MFNVVQRSTSVKWIEVQHRCVEVVLKRSVYQLYITCSRSSSRSISLAIQLFARSQLFLFDSAMPKAPKAKREYLCTYCSRAMKARSLDPRYVNVSFRIALGLSTSDADVQEFTRIKKALRELVERHYDYNLSEKEQKDDTREAFAAEVRRASVVEFVVVD
jgi:hypothetical protein